MKTIVKVIGSIVFAAAIYAIPTLFSVAFFYNWSPIAKTILVWLNTIELMTVVVLILGKVLEDDE